VEDNRDPADRLEKHGGKNYLNFSPFLPTPARYNQA
jgi:hypothetical protein